MTRSNQSTAAALDELVRGVPGVSMLYRSGGVLGRAVAAGKAAVHVSGEAGPYVEFAETADAVKVEVTVGVDADSAAQACRAVHDAIAAWLRARGRGEAVITVTVAQVTA